MTISLSPAQPWFNVQGQLCECPLWDARSSRLYWTDIPARRIYAFDQESGDAPRVFHEGGAQVGGFTLQEDGSLLLFRERDVAHLPPGGPLRILTAFDHAGSKRFNDVIADPQGRVFAGTIGKDATSGGLFRVDTDGSITQVASGTGCSNGLAFSVNLDFLYWVCSTRRRIFRFPYTVATGALGEPEVFFQGSEEDGYPDGLTTDHDGNLYSIRWAARTHGLVIFSPEGKELHRQALPALATSSACFCGPELRDLAITSAADDNDPERPADLFIIREMPVPGRLEFRSSIGG